MGEGWNRRPAITPAAGIAQRTLGKDASVAITKALIDAAARVAEETREPQELRDDKGTGMFVRVTGRDRRPVAFVRFSLGIGRSAKRVERKIGEISTAYPLEAARRRALELRTAGREGKDLVAETMAAQERKKQDEQLAVERMVPVVARAWLDHLDDNEKRWTEPRRIMESDVIPAWKDRRIEAIMKADVRALVEKITKRAKNSGKPGATGAQGGKVLATVKRWFEWCIDQDFVAANPCRRLKPEVRDGQCQRVLEDHEIRAFWRAADRMGYPFGICAQLLLLTAQRRSMVSQSTSREFDFETHRRWNIPKEHTKKVKQLKPHLVPVTDWMQALFERAMGESPAKKLLFSTNGESSISGWSKYKRKLNKKMLKELQREAKATGADPRAVKLVRWTLHDLRRSAATKMVRKPLGIEPKIIDLILHHMPAEISELRAIYMLEKNEDEMREALESWGAELRRILAAGPKLDENEPEFQADNAAVVQSVAGIGS
jgi:integrase